MANSAPAIPVATATTKVAAPPATYDRASDDVGNLLFLDHINLGIPDQQLATIFYVEGLGFTRDPFLRVGVTNMGINVGRSALHLPTVGRHVRGHIVPAQKLRGAMGYAMPGLDALARRLEKVAPQLAGTQFAYKVHGDHVAASCPWGNRVRCHAARPEYGNCDLAIIYVEFDVPRGTADGIARFYRQGMLAIATVEQRGADAVACVTIGTQKLLFRETDAPLPDYDGHHIAIFIAHHSGPHRFLRERGLVTEESNAHQYRFQDIVDPDSGKLLFTVEHEVRSLRHPDYNLPLLNRTPAPPA